MAFVKAGTHNKQIKNLKEEFVLTILNSNGINLEKFKKSELYNNHEAKFLFEHLYDILHESSDSNVNNKRPVDSSNIFAKFDNHLLEVSINGVSYQYNIINGLIHVNGEHPFPIGFIATVNAPAIPLEKQLEAMKQFHKDMKIYRLRREDALQKSWKFAKTFKVR